MIKYEVRKDNNSITMLKVSGHADHGEHGNDIVCSAVSTAVYLSLNLITKFKQKENIETKLKSGYTIITVLTRTAEIDSILENLVDTLDDLSKQYKKNIIKEG